ncbi:MAG: ZIP family metal transporter [Steroidobacteraceae bacterium]
MLIALYSLCIQSPRRGLGWLIALGGALILLHDAWQWLIECDPRIRQALLSGCIAAAATAAGCIPLLFARGLNARLADTLQGFGAGVMLAASAFSLLLPGLQAARGHGLSALQASSLIGAGVLLGAGLLLLLERYLPHEHFIKGQDHVRQSAHRLKRIWLFVFAIYLHNLPEGLAIGVAWGGSEPASAMALGTGIAIQDIPEGMVIATALLSAGYARRVAIGWAMASGLIEPIGALLGAAVVTLSNVLLPWGMAFAAGAMLFVISHEIIPESHRQGHEASATTGLMLGFVLMMMLDTIFA